MFPPVVSESYTRRVLAKFRATERKHFFQGRPDDEDDHDEEDCDENDEIDEANADKTDNEPTDDDAEERRRDGVLDGMNRMNGIRNRKTRQTK